MESDKEKEAYAVQLAIINERLKMLNDNIVKMDKKFVTHDEFRPVRMIVYGAVCMVLTAVGAAIIAVVLKGAT